jgi:transcriptional regulator with XRE-family HTH domain
MNINIIKQLRSLFDMNQQALAEKSGLSRSYLSEVETGKKQPSMDSLEAIARCFNLRLSQFLWLSENSLTIGQVAENYQVIKKATD